MFNLWTGEVSGGCGVHDGRSDAPRLLWNVHLHYIMHNARHSSLSLSLFPFQRSLLLLSRRFREETVSLSCFSTQNSIRVRGSIRGLEKKRGREGCSECRREQEDFVVTMNGVNQTKAALD